MILVVGSANALNAAAALSLLLRHRFSRLILLPVSGTNNNLAFSNLNLSGENKSVTEWNPETEFGNWNQQLEDHKP